MPEATTLTTVPGGPRTYGNWRRVQSVGIANLGLAGTVVLFVGLVLIVLGFMFSLLLSLAAAVLTVMAIVPLIVRDRHNRNLFQRATAGLAWGKGPLRGPAPLPFGPAFPVAEGPLWPTRGDGFDDSHRSQGRLWPAFRPCYATRGSPR